MSNGSGGQGGGIWDLGALSGPADGEPPVPPAPAPPAAAAPTEESAPTAEAATPAAGTTQAAPAQYARQSDVPTTTDLPATAPDEHVVPAPPPWAPREEPATDAGSTPWATRTDTPWTASAGATPAAHAVAPPPVAAPMPPSGSMPPSAPYSSTPYSSAPNTSTPHASAPYASTPYAPTPTDSPPPDVTPPPRTPPQRLGPRASTPLVIGAVVAVLAVVGIALLVFTGNKDDGGTIAGPADAGSSSTFVNSTPDVVPDTSSDTSSSSDPEPTPESSTTTEDAEQQALAQLEALREQSLQQVTPQGQWVAQLASKVPGIVDPEQTTTSGSHTFMAVDILAEHEALANGDNLGASVVLLRSTDYGKRQLYQGQPLWVTFSVGSFFSADDVRSWCAQRFGNLSGESLKNACAPRQLKAIYA